MLNRRWLALVAVTGALAAGGCGSTASGHTATAPPGGHPAKAAPTHASPTTSTGAATSVVSLAAYGQRYVDLVTPANQAIGRFNDQLSLMTSPTGAQIKVIAAPVIATLSRARTGLLEDRFTASSEPAVHALATSIGTLVTTLRSLDSPAGATTPAALAALRTAAGKTADVASTVRVALHLTSNL